MPVGDIVITAMVFRNIHVCFNGNITSSYFSVSPPSFAEYVANGPRAVVADI